MRIATVSGIPIRLHWSFLALLGGYLFFSTITSGLAWGAHALLLAVALFTSVVLHELGHAMAARAFGIRTAHITLFPFGGVAAITRPPRTPSEELIVAIAGPAVNFVLLATALTLWALFGGTALLAIAAINGVMGVFNLVPAYPMDGGRVLRALLATRVGYRRASEVAIRVGRGFAWLFVAVGLVAWAPTLALVGGFLLFALGAERRRLEFQTRRAAAEALLRRARPSTFPHPVPADTGRY